MGALESVGRQSTREARIAARTSSLDDTRNRATGQPAFARLHFEEEMVRLHQQIAALIPDRARRAIQFIGSRDGEGTTSVAREFGLISATRFGCRVLLLEFTNDRPAETTALESRPVPVSGTTLWIAPLPQQLIAPSHARSSGVWNETWQRLRETYDLIVIDSPPASRAPEVLTLSGQVDGVVLVLEAETTRWPVAAHAVESIVRSGGRVLGVVLNKRRHYIPSFVYNWL